MNEIRTYMSFTTPLDPAKIETIPDMDMSYALASTLVEWGPDKQLSAGVAERWSEIGPQKFRFTLRKGLKWSDGSLLTSQDVKESFQRSFKAHPADLRSLMQMLEAIECPSPQEVDLKIKPQVHLDALLGKLTEPNYGVLKSDGRGAIDLSVTTGPFFVFVQSLTELTLKQNPNWHGRYVGMADQVIVRKPKPDMDLQVALLNDSWPNLIETSSLINKDTLGRYKSEKYEIRERPLDKFFHLQLGKRTANTEGRQLLGFLQSKIKRSEFTEGLSGFSETTQIFPPGYQLNDPHFTYPKEGNITLPDRFQKKPVEILITPARVSEVLRKNIEKAIERATGVKPVFVSVPLEDLRTKKIAGEYDLYAGTVGLADPDPEGVMSFYLEGDAPVIPSKGSNFLERLDTARKQANTEKKLTQMRSILHDAVCEHYLLSLFHLSTIGIARRELDLSKVPQSDESVTLSKVRFKGQR